MTTLVRLKVETNGTLEMVILERQWILNQRFLIWICQMCLLRIFPEYVLGKINSQRRMSEGTFLSTRPRYGKKFESSPNIEVVDESGRKGG